MKSQSKSKWNTLLHKRWAFYWISLMPAEPAFNMPLCIHMYTSNVVTVCGGTSREHTFQLSHWELNNSMIKWRKERRQIVQMPIFVGISLINSMLCLSLSFSFSLSLSLPLTPHCFCQFAAFCPSFFCTFRKSLFASAAAAATVSILQAKPN